MLKPHETLALRHLDSHGVDSPDPNADDDGESLAACLVYIDLNKRGLVDMQKGDGKGGLAKFWISNQGIASITHMRS